MFGFSQLLTKYYISLVLEAVHFPY